MNWNCVKQMTKSISRSFEYLRIRRILGTLDLLIVLPLILGLIGMNVRVRVRRIDKGVLVRDVRCELRANTFGDIEKALSSLRGTPSARIRIRRCLFLLAMSTFAALLESTSIWPLSPPPLAPPKGLPAPPPNCGLINGGGIPPNGPGNNGTLTEPNWPPPALAPKPPFVVAPSACPWFCCCCCAATSHVRLMNIFINGCTLNDFLLWHHSSSFKNWDIILEIILKRDMGTTAITKLRICKTL